MTINAGKSVDRHAKRRAAAKDRREAYEEQPWAALLTERTGRRAKRVVAWAGPFLTRRDAQRYYWGAPFGQWWSVAPLANWMRHHDYQSARHEPGVMPECPHDTVTAIGPEAPGKGLCGACSHVVDMQEREAAR